MMASDFENCFYVPLIGRVCVKGSEANGRRERRGFGIQVRADYRRRRRIAIAAAVAAAAAAVAIASI